MGPAYFKSRRSPVNAHRGMVATSHPLAATAGLRMLMEGGNAVDAAVASAAALNVLEPMSTGVGGDLFALVWMNAEKRVRAFNASGRAPMAASVEEMNAKGLTSIPFESAYSVTVPGHRRWMECPAFNPRQHAPVPRTWPGHRVCGVGLSCPRG